MRRNGGPDDGSVAVELVEVDRAHTLADPAGGGPGDHPDDAPDDARREAPVGRRRALWWVGAGVILALVVAVVSVNVVEARRDAARREALAALPWVLPSLSDPLQEVWRAPGGYVLAEGAGLLVMVDLGDANQSLVAVDRESGAVAWERAGHGESCQPLIDTRQWSNQASMDLSLESELLVCLPDTLDVFVDAEGARVGTELVGEGTVELVDVATGRAVASMPIEGSVIGLEAVGEDVVVASVLADGSLTVVRAVGGTGEPVWTYRGEPARMPADGVAWAYVYDEVLMIVGEDVTAAISLETAREVPVPDGVLDDVGPINAAIAPLPDGSAARWRYDPRTGSAESGRVIEVDGSTRFTFEGEPWWQGRVDGSAAGVLVVQQDDTADDHDSEGRLIGLDLATGDQLWSVPDTGTQRLLEIEGLAVATGVKTSVIDVRTGRRLWERPFSAEVAWVPLTDGDTVLLPERGAGGDGLVAVDLRTGAESWWMPVSGPVNDVRVEDSGLVLLLVGTEVVAYR